MYQNSKTNRNAAENVGAMERETISENHVSSRKTTGVGRKSKKMLLTLLFMTLILPNSAFAQLFAPPTIPVTLTHPPMLGLKVDKIVFNQATGECADQVVNELISLFVSNNVTVMDRDNLTAILREQNFSYSGYIDQTTALSIGKIIGPSAMITVKVLACQPDLRYSYKNVERNEKDKAGNVRKWTAIISYATLKVNLKVSIQTVDLTTGRIFAAKVFDTSQTATTQGEVQSEKEKVVPPDDYELREKAFRVLIQQVKPLYFPWIEMVSVPFFKDKIDEKGSKSAWDALNVRNYEGAIDLAKQYWEWSQDENNFTNKKGVVDEKDRVKSLSHANYNLGTLCFILGNYDTALQHLREAQKLLPLDKYIANTINDCTKAKLFEEENQRIDHRSAAEIAKSEQQVQQAQQLAATKVLKNADIIDLTKSKMPKSVILQKINSSQCSFDTSTAALIELSKAGVDEEVIALMLTK